MVLNGPFFYGFSMFFLPVFYVFEVFYGVFFSFFPFFFFPRASTASSFFFESRASRPPACKVLRACRITSGCAELGPLLRL